jgi:hypothetical protein
MLNLNQTETDEKKVVYDGLITNNLSEDTAKCLTNEITLGENQNNQVGESLSSAQNRQNGERVSEETENTYECHYLTGGAKHPGKIIETPGLANIKPPRPTHRPCLPKKLIEDGEISQIQLERIIYTGQAHGQFLQSGTNARAGISIGDGTGVGKTTTLLGIILNNWFSGRKRSIWFSVKSDLIKVVRDEMQRLGIHIPIQLVNEYNRKKLLHFQKVLSFAHINH